MWERTTFCPFLHCTMYNCTNARNAGHCEVQCGRETADITSKKGKRYLKKGRSWFPFFIVKFSKEMADPSGERELQIYIAQFKKRMKCEKLRTIPREREELKACFKDARNGGHGEVQCVREQHYAKLGEKRRTLPRKRERDTSRKGGTGSPLGEVRRETVDNT